MVCKKFLNKKWLKILKEEKAQSTVEFAIIVAAMLIIVIALSLIWKTSSNGLLIEHALNSASHHIEQAAIGIVGDVFSC